MNENYKSGFVAIVGRPNVGKSTLLNKFFKTKLSIVSPKAQTTRNKIQGIYTTDDFQIVFVDTPGIHKPKNTLGEAMNEFAYLSLEGVDLVLMLVDVSHPLGEGDLFVMESIKKAKVPVLLVLNKIDKLTDPEVIETNINSYKEAFPFDGGITLSAEEGFNTDKLLEMILQRLPNGPQYYPDDQLMDQPVKFVVSEIIREKVLLLTKDEVPHSVAVTVDTFKTDTKNRNLININATIVVERPSQKKIIIGKNGDMIKNIGRLARLEMDKFLDKKVYLELFVKVEEDWRNNKHYLKEFGYNIDDYKK